MFSSASSVEAPMRRSTVPEAATLSVTDRVTAVEALPAVSVVISDTV